MFKSGYVSLIGRTNVGKSSLLNSLVHEKVAIATNKPQILTRDFKKDVITALFMMGCNDRLEMGLPNDYSENYFGFLEKIDSLVATPNYFERIEANMASDSYSQDLQDSLQRWLFLERMKCHRPTICWTNTSIEIFKVLRASRFHN